MMPNKTSFIVHIDSLDVIDDLTDEQCGELLRAMKAYHLKDDFTPSSIVKVAFSPFKNQFIRDAKKYESIVERNRINGLKGGRPPLPNKPTGLSGNPNKPKKADSDSKSDNDSDNKKEVINPLFVLFWENYPKKSDKKKAEKAFSRMNTTNQNLAIADCKTRFLKTDKKYIPLATTYINGERWNDEIEQVVNKHSGFQDKDYQSGAITPEWAK